MSIQLYNTMSRKKEEFKPIVPGHVGIYVCGPTVYGPPHLGHAKSYISFDVLVKHFRTRGYKVRYVQNITDVGHLTDDADAGEDKIQKQAKIDRVHPYEIVDRWMFQYFRDMETLKINHPNFYVRATQHIGEQIEAIEKLIEKGYAYEVNGNVYYDIHKFSCYGKLSGRTLEDQKESGRIETRSDKRDPRDFALWKKAEPNHVLFWNSPWGTGYPGWHIECSVMSMKYLGETIDIHGGGLENSFPHHECEIAQAESLTGKPFVNYWVHHNMVTVDGVKMGKSLGNFKTCAELLSRHSPEALRAFILSTHYRSPANYTEEAIIAAATGLNRLSALYSGMSAIVGASSADSGTVLPEIQEMCLKADKAIGEAIDDDLDTPGAIALIYNFVTDVNRISSAKSLSPASASEVLKIITIWGNDVLGIIPMHKSTSESHDIAPIMDLLLEIRKEMKISKRFDISDKIRDRAKEAGIIIEDTKEGVRWRKA
ncbi:MAG: cysteine--tRNA ligase [Candidatus Riflebacteria bacterium]|nr:cysteine--tRNA ligase [Candidatus Riflebacteria bacterium]